MTIFLSDRVEEIRKRDKQACSHFAQPTNNELACATFVPPRWSLDSTI
ncbi:MAG: hypothetical protein WA667_18145 [Candidatus Nitrosopolaris sp.]